MEDLERFGRIVRTRREELGIQQEDMDQYGGPSSTTMSRIERGVAPPSAKTLRKLDTGLSWQIDSAKRTLGGGDPTPLTPGTTTQKPARTAQTSAQFRDPEGALIDLLAAIDATASAMEESVSLDGLPALAREKMQLARAKFLGVATTTLIMACEVIGEGVASEDANDLGVLVERLGTHIRRLTELRGLAARIRAATVDKEKSNVMEVETKPDAPGEAETQEEVLTRQAAGEKAEVQDPIIGDLFRGEDPGVGGDQEGEQGDQFGGGQI